MTEHSEIHNSSMLYGLALSVILVLACLLITQNVFHAHQIVSLAICHETIPVSRLKAISNHPNAPIISARQQENALQAVEVPHKLPRLSMEYSIASPQMKPKQTLMFALIQQYTQCLMVEITYSSCLMIR
jgi:hypothetical protein